MTVKGDRTSVDQTSFLGAFFTVLYQNAVSMYCRLGFAVKKGPVISAEQLHPSWKNAPSLNRLKYVQGGQYQPFTCVVSLEVFQNISGRFLFFLLVNITTVVSSTYWST